MVGSAFTHPSRMPRWNKYISHLLDKNKTKVPPDTLVSNKRSLRAHRGTVLYRITFWRSVHSLRSLREHTQTSLTASRHDP